MSTPIFLQATIGDYRLVDFLGAGGMGEVYRAVHVKTGQVAAVKVLTQRTHSTGLGERFRNEARIHARLRHPNIATFYDYRQVAGRPCILMEYVDGETLAERVRRQGGLPPDEARRIFLSVAQAMAYMHHEGIVHRDLKPNNIKVCSHGEVKLLDFGIAKVLCEPGLTRTGDVMGTLHYLSPEQLKGQRADARADVWALGVMLYEMLTGALPFEAVSPTELHRRILRAQYLPVSSVNAAAPPDLEAMIRRCLSRRPGSRYDSAEALLLDLIRPNPGAGAPAAARPDGPSPRRSITGAFRAPYRWAALVAAAAGLGLLLLMQFWTAPAPPPPPNSSGTPSVPVVAPALAPRVWKPARIDAAGGAASVYRNSQPVGVTPYAFNAPLGDRVTFVLRREGFQDRNVEFEINEGRNEYSYTLEKVRTGH